MNANPGRILPGELSLHEGTPAMIWPLPRRGIMDVTVDLHAA